MSGPRYSSAFASRVKIMRFILIGVAALFLTGCSETQQVPTAPDPAPTSPTPPQPPAPAPVADIVVSGLVHETAPTEHRVVAGAAITAMSGERTATAVADDGGRFTVKLPPGEIRITVTASRYDAATRTLNSDTDTTVSIALPYTHRMIEETWGQYCCTPTLLTEVSVRLPVHYSGTLSYTAGACFGGCLASEYSLNCATIRDVETGTEIARVGGQYDSGVGGSVQVQGGHTYELTVFPTCFGTPPAPVPGFVIVGFFVHLQRPI